MLTLSTIHPYSPKPQQKEFDTDEAEMFLNLWQSYMCTGSSEWVSESLQSQYLILKVNSGIPSYKYNLTASLRIQFNMQPCLHRPPPSMNSNILQKLKYPKTPIIPAYS